MLAGNVDIIARSIVTGEAQSDEAGAAQSTKIRELHPGQYFGEISYFLKTVSSASVQATNYTSVGYLRNEDAHELYFKFPLYKQQVEANMMQNYVDEQRLFLIQSLRRLEHLEDPKVATEEMLIKLAYCFKLRFLEKS